MKYEIKNKKGGVFAERIYTEGQFRESLLGLVVTFLDTKNVSRDQILPSRRIFSFLFFLLFFTTVIIITTV